MAHIPILTPEELEEFKNDNFPFENIAFEGGGSKGTAHLGAVRVLEEIGVWKNMKRFAGTSAGSMVAMCGALGMDSHEMEAVLGDNSSSRVFDAAVKYISFLPNMLWYFGWNPGNKMEKLIGKVLKDNLGSAEATFVDLYRKTGRELCVVVTNVNQQDTQYCHVKITPTMQIKQAVRASISIPGVLMPVRDNKNQYLVDGGVINNYPIRVFDGWYLSMEPEDSLLLKIAKLDNVASAWNPNYQFGHEPNKKTIGVLLYSEEEKEMYKDEFEKRATQCTPQEIPLPQTKLAREHREQFEKSEEARRKHEELAGAYTAFVGVLRKHFDVTRDHIPEEELKQALDKAQADGGFTDVQRALLFEGSQTSDDVIEAIKKARSNDIHQSEHGEDDHQISILDMTLYCESQGREFRSIYRGYETREIRHLHQFFISLVDTMQLACRRFFFERFDLYRSIGIDTGYLGTLDLSMEHEDVDYLLQQGKRGCLAFLRSYKNQPQDTEPAEN